MATTNFFTLIAEVEFTGTIQLLITKCDNNNLVVSTMLRNEQCGDNAKNLIPPMVYNATAEEFDEGYFHYLTTPIEKVSNLMVNMEKYLKQADEAKKQSAMEKEKTDKENKEKEAREKKYKDSMAKADDLEKEGKFRDAWSKVPSVNDYPEKADEIRKRRNELSDKFSAPSLFTGMEDSENQTPPPTPTLSTESSGFYIENEKS